MKIFFFGIYELGLLSLTRLIEAGAEISGIATKLQEGPHLQKFSDIARRRRIPLFATGGRHNPEIAASVQSVAPDLIVVSGYHRLIPASILALAAMGGINLHPSLLPQYRGPCPWKWAIVRGERRTGVTVHEMDESFDTGRILAQEPLDIGRDETGGQLFRRLCGVGSRVLVETVAALEKGTLTPRVQVTADSSHFGTPGDRDTRIDWSADVETIRNLARGFHPRPGAWTSVDGERVVIESVRSADVDVSNTPGTILGTTPDGLLVATGGGVVLAKVSGADASRLNAGMAFEDPTAEKSRLA